MKGNTGSPKALLFRSSIPDSNCICHTFVRRRIKLDSDGLIFIVTHDFVISHLSLEGCRDVLDMCKRFGKYMGTAVGKSGRLTVRSTLLMPEDVLYLAAPKHSVDRLMTCFR